MAKPSICKNQAFEHVDLIFIFCSTRHRINFFFQFCSEAVNCTNVNFFFAFADDWLRVIEKYQAC